MTEVTELNHCPFCGGTVDKISGMFGTVIFKCHKCGAYVYFYGAEADTEATKAWNRRYQDERQ